MKKLICLVLALICFATVAMAESTGLNVEISGEAIPADASVSMNLTAEDGVRNDEAQKLVDGESAEAYFGEVQDAAGEIVSLQDALGSENMNVFDFWAVSSEGYDASYGDVTVAFSTSTAYVAGQRAVVLVAIANDESNIQWVMLDTAVGDNRIEAAIPASVMASIQSAAAEGATALLAVVSLEENHPASALMGQNESVEMGVPSKTVADMTNVAIECEGGTGWMLRLVTEDVGEYQAKAEICSEEVAKLVASAAAESYFANAKNEEGEAVSLNAALNTENPEVFEFWAIVAEGYESSYGDATATFTFTTPYDEGEMIEVLIGVKVGDNDITWLACENVEVGAAGEVKVPMSSDVLQDIQNATQLEGAAALLAVVSAD